MAYRYATVNRLAGAMAERAGELGNMTLPSLRSEAGYGCDTQAEAIRIHKYETRGSLITMILLEEFSEDLDVTIDSD